MCSHLLGKKERKHKARNFKHHQLQRYVGKLTTPHSIPASTQITRSLARHQALLRLERGKEAPSEREMEVRAVIAAPSLSPAIPATSHRKSHVCASSQNLSFPVRSTNSRFFPRSSSRRMRVYGSTVTLDPVRLFLISIYQIFFILFLALMWMSCFADAI